MADHVMPTGVVKPFLHEAFMKQRIHGANRIQLFGQRIIGERRSPGRRKTKECSPLIGTAIKLDQAGGFCTQAITQQFGLFFKGGMAHEIMHGKAFIYLLAHPSQHTQHQNGVPAQLKEIIVQTYVVTAKHFLPDSGQLPLYPGSG
ncbi:hypothetical protein ASF84_27610 [Pseudomonas sp. Leaf127]|nr:hypothetical protein ASF84_27610 [Pseudomonas sp. Leaf127]